MTDDKPKVELHMYGSWEDKAPTLNASEEGFAAVRWLSGDSSVQMTPDVADVVRRLFRGQESGRVTLDQGLRAIVAQLEKEANVLIPQMEQPVRFDEVPHTKARVEFYIDKSGIAQSIVDAVNAAAMAWKKHGPKA